MQKLHKLVIVLVIVVEVSYKCIGVHWPNLFVGTGAWRGRVEVRWGDECCKWKRVFGTPLQSFIVRFGFPEGGGFQELNILVSPHFRTFRILKWFFYKKWNY